MEKHLKEVTLSLRHSPYISAINWVGCQVVCNMALQNGSTLKKNLHCCQHMHKHSQTSINTIR